MIFAMLGDILIGDAVWTGPDGASETRKAALVVHPVATGKPVVQDMGDELDAKKLGFFFDETFCAPTAELRRLEGLMNARSPVAYVGGDGAFRGRRWIVTDLEVQTQKTTPNGRPTRLKVSATLQEVPIPDALDFLASLAAGAALAVVGTAGLAIGAQVSVTVGPLSVGASVEVGVSP